MSLVLASDVCLAYGKKVLFDQAAFGIGPTDRIGLVGANGTGKSSLMKILAGSLRPDSGQLRFRRQARVGYLPQELEAAGQGSLLTWVLSGVPGRDSLVARLDQTQAALDSAQDVEEQLELSQTLADLHAQVQDFESRFGPHRAQAILQGLGFSSADFDRPVEQFSGGWWMRGALASLLLQEPDLLLLDEPTNHLDLPTLAWFDAFLRRSNKALLLISHDREFLNRQVNRIFALEVEGLKTYTGNFEAYKAAREEERAQLLAAAERQTARRGEMQAFIDRFGAKASKAKQAQSRAKMLEKEEIIQVHRERTTVHFRFPEVPRSGRDVVTLQNVSHSYGSVPVYRGLEARLERGQKVAVAGVNGAGKTTLLKLISGELEPATGSVTLGQNVTLGYYAQHHADTLDKTSSVLDTLRHTAPTRSDVELRSVLGAFLFSGDDVDKKIGVLSGGERARVALARLLLVPSNLLVMDEPTNHLDLDSSEMLIEALQGYGGTLLFVSHNRGFLNRLATHVWEVRDGTVLEYPGNLDAYLAKLDQLASDAATSSDAPGTRTETKLTDKDRRRMEAEARQRRSALEGPVKKEIAKIEARIAELEVIQKKAEADLADPGLYNDFARAKPIMDAHREAKAELEGLYGRWEEAQNQLSALQQSQAST